jgi:excisionase family DNA binding protein
MGTGYTAGAVKPGRLSPYTNPRLLVPVLGSRLPRRQAPIRLAPGAASPPPSILNTRSRTQDIAAIAEVCRREKDRMYEQFVDADVAADFLGISRAFLLRLARAGQIPAHPLPSGEQRLRRTWRFRISELNNYMENTMIDPR